MSKANLQEAKLWVANLAAVDMSSANLAYADLAGANLHGTNLSSAYLKGANLKQVRFDENTILPDGTRWTPNTDMERFTNPEHPEFWQPKWVQ
jgi:uncharacterized protein YjbI with pentapeptide repeats